MKQLQIALTAAALVSGFAFAETETPHQIEKFGAPADSNPDVVDDRDGLKIESAAEGAKGPAAGTDEAEVYPDALSEGNPDLGPEVPEADQPSAEAATVYPDSVSEGNPDLEER